MKKKQGIRIAVAAAFLAASTASGLALAVDEVEQNYPVTVAQKLTVGSDGSVTVYGVMGSAVGTMFADIDFYQFYARAGDTVTVDIDDGMKPLASGLRSVDTTLAILDLESNGYLKIRENFDFVVTVTTPLDCDKTLVANCNWDAYIPNFAPAADGWYTVAVTGHPRTVLSGGFNFKDGTTAPSNGSYTLIISGASPEPVVVVPPEPVVVPPVVPEEQIIAIDIKPGNKQHTKINPKAKGVIPVALLSSATFDALNVDRSSLTFGATGDENSLAHCQKEGKDVNADGRLDLVCHFDNGKANFDMSVVEGTVKGKGAGGKLFKGQGHLKVFGAEKRKDD